ncbi:arsenical-resistance protein [Ramicandelaber brevisporus]|nr:arsenical-resistance protein [Ramicandelaber brevisporus]
MALSLLDRYLSVWIALAMAGGVLIGNYVPSAKHALDSAKFADVSAPIAAGMIWMMYPVLCKVRYEMIWNRSAKMNSVTIHHLGISMIINWLVAPLLMLALAWATLPDLSEYRSGLVLVGTARCIAMVLIWNTLAGGDQEYCAIVVVVNSLLQIALYGPLSYVLVVYLSNGSLSGINVWPIIRSVLVFLGIPLAAGFFTRVVGHRVLGEKGYGKFLRIIGPTSLLALLFVIITLFASQGQSIVTNIGTVFRVVVPLLLYFFLVFFGTLALCFFLCTPYPIMVTQCFTAASNNFELAIAVASSVYGVDSKEAMAATVGPLVEVPVLVMLVYLLKWINARWYSMKVSACTSDKCKLKTIIFACVRNAGRSQIAAATFNKMHAFREYRAISAGTNPANTIHTEIIPVLEDLKVNIDKLEPKLLTEEMVSEAFAVVTMGCGEQCPYFPGVKIIAWDIEDPHGKSPEEVTAIAANIRENCKGLEKELLS